MTKDEALRMAIEYLKEAENIIEGKCEQGGYFQKPIQACKEALEKPTTEQSSLVQEPVLVNATTHDGQTYKIEVSASSREWVELSDWDYVEIYGHANLVDWRVVRAIEAKLKEKNELFGNSR